MAKIKGLDNGYLYTKDDEKRIFRSAFKRTSVSVGSTPFITIDGIDYSIGTGDVNVDFDKSDSEMNKVATLTNLALTGNDEYYLCVDLPIGQYASQKDKMKKMIMGYNESEVIFNGNKMDLVIKDVFVLPQCIGALLSLDVIPRKVIMIDFGGLTIDVASLEVVCGNPQLRKYMTLNEGIQKIYSELGNRICQECNFTSIDPSDIDDILVNGIRTKGKEKPKDFLSSILREYLAPIMKKIQVTFTDVNTDIFICGGSAIIFENLVKEYYPQALLTPNSQFANAIGNAKAGMQKFGALVQQQQQHYVCNRR